MGKHFADSIDVGAVAQEQGSVGVTEAVERNVLGDSSCWEPFLELIVYDRRRNVFEY